MRAYQRMALAHLAASAREAAIGLPISTVMVRAMSSVSSSSSVAAARIRRARSAKDVVRYWRNASCAAAMRRSTSSGPWAS